MHTSQSIVPVTLKNLCLRTIAIEISATTLLSSTLFKKDLWLSIALSQKIFDKCMSEAVEDVNKVVHYFLKNPLRTPLERICFQNLRGVQVDLVFQLVQGNLQTLAHLDVRGCHTFPKKLWDLVNTAPKLESLKTTKLETPLRNQNLKALVVDWTPSKVIQKVQHHVQRRYYNEMLENVLPNLKSMDLSWCPWIKRLTALSSAKNLEILRLRNCNITSIVGELCELSELRVLDLSVGTELENNRGFNGTYVNPNEVFDLLTNSLVKLESINVSGTNLDGCALETLTSTCKVIGSIGSVVPTEVIKKNYNMPKTMYNHLCLLYDANSENGNCIDANELLQIQIQLMENLRHNDDYRNWVLKSTLKLLELLDKPQVCFDTGLRMKLWLMVNRVLHSQVESKKAHVPESILSLVFQIYLRLLPVGETVKDEGIRKEVLRLGKYLLTLRPSSFVYLKTETLLFRLLHRISVEPNVCEYFSTNAGVKSCIDFFKSLQIYLGYSLSVRQASQIVQVVWKTILNFMTASPVGTQHFLKHSGLSWIWAHLNWFKNDQRTKMELCKIFRDILKLLDQGEVAEGRDFVITKPERVLINKITKQITETQ
ncbi:unnamed protein product [Orchesella dallaii]|uniref:Zer-1-like leucine-rich repeats region domain-containing protein n=1 Tax=Orchesella dallaii TaxID=48710 RepID=A0ABP1QI62_9HEXA